MQMEKLDLMMGALSILNIMALRINSKKVQAMWILCRKYEEKEGKI